MVGGNTIGNGRFPRWLRISFLLFISVSSVTLYIPNASELTQRPSDHISQEAVPATQRNILYVGGSGPENYTKIQYAIDNASTGDLIFVYEGTYYEHVIVNKKVSLRGQTRDQTIIDGSGTGNVVKLITDRVDVQGFTLQNGGIGLYIVHTSNHTIAQNRITDNWEGIGLLDSAQNLISENIITNNGFEGINTVQTTSTIISDNTIVDHLQGIYLIESSGNTIVRNVFYSNSRGIEIQEASNSNTLYHNNFFTSSENNAYDKCDNTWDDGYPSGGNYWDDYTGGDGNHDGIGDTPYIVDGGAGNRDYYPLMDPWNHPPYQPSDPLPSDGATNTPLNPQLSVFVRDPEGNVMDVSFYDAATHQLIGTDADVASSTRAMVTWNGLHNMTLYRWYTVADDGEETIQSEIWEFTTGSGVNLPPAAPAINGTLRGTIGHTYPYTFVTTDPENDEVSYFVDWGDETSCGWVGPNQSGQPCIISHTWTTRGTYTIRAKAKDVNNAESDWTMFTIKMPKNLVQIPSSFMDLVERLFERFPHAFPFLQYLISVV